MNNNFVKFAFVGMACAASCMTTSAAPRGGGHGRPAGVAQQARSPHVARPAAVRPSAAVRTVPARHFSQPAVARHGYARPEPRHHAPPPPRAVRRHLPRNAHYWARPAVPMWRVGALRAWEWVEAEWVIFVNGVCYYGDGYYYDGYNYYYNGAYHTTPPMSIFV